MTTTDTVQAAREALAAWAGVMLRVPNEAERAAFHAGYRAAEAEIARLREALNKIANMGHGRSMQAIARAALASPAADDVQG